MVECLDFGSISQPVGPLHRGGNERLYCRFAYVCVVFLAAGAVRHANVGMRITPTMLESTDLQFTHRWLTITAAILVDQERRGLFAGVKSDGNGERERERDTHIRSVKIDLRKS